MSEQKLIDVNKLIDIFTYKKYEITKYCGGYRYLSEEDKKEYDGINSILDEISRISIIDAVPVVHGKWLPLEKSCLGENWFIYSCSICESDAPEEGTCKTPYCPICGAKMDGGKS